MSREVSDFGAKEYRCGRVAIMGPTNAGKSTLLNALIGQKVTIVTPKPQTTRNQITGILTDKRAQIIFMDTPGISQLRGHLSKTMIQAAWQSLAQADLVMLVLDANLYVRHPELFDRDLQAMAVALNNSKLPLLIVPNKIDLFADKSRMLPLLTKIGETWPGAEIFPVSALNEDGLDGLKELIESRLPPGPAFYPEDQISTASLRFMAAEIIREKLYMHLYEEVPYFVAVDVEDWRDDEQKELSIIHAVIYVAKSMYKSMVIGKGGSGIKKIGTEARKEIMELVGHKVHLELWVKVRENWTEDMAFLREIGQSAHLE